MSATTLRRLSSPEHLRWLRWVPQLMPPFLLNRITEHSLNAIFSAELRAGRLDFLADKSVCIQVTDLDFSLVFSGRGQALQIHAPGMRTEVTLTSDSNSLLAMITGNADPDTLFFRRKLVLEGDTELGLALKNFLDSCEPQQLLPSHLYKVLKRYADAQRASHEASE